MATGLLRGIFLLPVIAVVTTMGVACTTKTVVTIGLLGWTRMRTLRPEQVPAVEAAVAAVDALLEERHPTAGRPAWFATSVAQRQRLLGENTLEVAYYVERKVPLAPGQAWEQSPAGPVLIGTNPNGERYVVITRDTGEFQDIFVAHVDLLSSAVQIVTDTDLAAIDPAEIEHPVSRGGRRGST